MKHPDKGQHRIPQVYLRQWSFRDQKSNWETLCVMKIGDPTTHYKYVKSFTKKINLFDTTLLDEGAERFFDEKCIYVEDNYNDVLKALDNDQYDAQIRIYLTEFISNLFVRQQSTYEFFRGLVQDSLLRKKFLNEITILDSTQPAELVKAVFEEMAIDPEHTIESKTSAFIIQAWNHFNIALSRFNHILLKVPEDCYWHTTDNPVIVNGLGKGGWILGGDAELYFPISKRYLVYMYINDAIKNPLLMNFKVDIINPVPFKIVDIITKDVIIKSMPDYFIMGEDHGYFDASREEKVPRYIPIEFAKQRPKL